MYPELTAGHGNWISVYFEPDLLHLKNELRRLADLEMAAEQEKQIQFKNLVWASEINI